MRHYRSDGYNHLFARGQAVFTGAFTGDALADMLLGFPTFSLLAANDNPQALRTSAFDAVRPARLAALLARSPSTPACATSSTAAGRRRRSHARLRPRDETLQPVGQNGVPRSGLNTDCNNFAPRVGVELASAGHAGH